MLPGNVNRREEVVRQAGYGAVWCSLHETHQDSLSFRRPAALNVAARIPLEADMWQSKG